MVPRSKQPNDSDHCFNSDQSLEGWDDDNYAWDDSQADAGYPEDGYADGGCEVVTAEGRLSPADFSSDELSLARDLNQLFNLEQEELPPGFVQALCTDDSAWAAPTGLTPRVTYHVFRRLHLPRRLFGTGHPASATGPRGLRRLGRVPRTLALSSILALVMLSLVTVAPSFAQGMRILLGQTGVMVAPSYPKPLVFPLVQTQYLSLRAAQAAVPFHIYWFGNTPEGYSYQSLLLHMGQAWADGPVVELQYTTTNPTEGYARLVVREFRPAPGATVLLVVAQGATYSAQVGQMPAIYIDGGWVNSRQGIMWEHGVQAELLYEADGLIFWITANQQAGATMASLEGMAGLLKPLSLEPLRPHLPELLPPGQAEVAAALEQPALGEVVALIPAGASPETGAAVYIALGLPPNSA